MRGVAAGVAAAVLLICTSGQSVAAQETADLQITKVANTKTVRAGGIVTYTVTVTNLGPGAASGVVFGDSLPDQLNLVDSTCGTVSAFCTVETLPAGASAAITIVATPIANLAQGERRIQNTAFVFQSVTSDPNPSNDQASVTVQFAGPR